MNPSIRKSLPALCCWLLAAGYIMLPAGFLAIRARHRHEMWEQTERASEVMLRIPTRLIRWEIEGREIRWQGRLFDVRNISQQEDTLIVTGLFDEDEQRLEKDFASLWNQRQWPGDGNGLSMGRFFHLLLHFDNQTFTFKEPDPERGALCLILPTDPPPFGLHQPTTPPPEKRPFSEYNI